MVKLHVSEIPRIGKFLVVESRSEVTRGWGEGQRGVTAWWIEFLPTVMNIFENSDGGCMTP